MLGHSTQLCNASPGHWDVPGSCLHVLQDMEASMFTSLIRLHMTFNTISSNYYDLETQPKVLEYLSVELGVCDSNPSLGHTKE